MQSFETSFDTIHSHELPFVEYGKSFWDKALIEFVDEIDEVKKLEFFKLHSLNFDEVYCPDVGYAYNSTDWNRALVALEHKLHDEGIKSKSPNNKELLSWYYKNQQISYNDPSTHTTLEKKYFLLLRTRFTLRVIPHYEFETHKIKIFNKYLEEQILQKFPKISSAQMISNFSQNKVLDRLEAIKITREEISEIVKNIKDKKDSATVQEKEYLYGFVGCKSTGIDYLPENRKVIKAFVHGKNVAIFDTMLPKIFEPQKTETMQEKPEVKSKIVWSGTPNEFGAIFDMLMKQGYIPTIRDRKNTVTLLLDLFEIQNNRGKPVNFEYLYKCFGEKKRGYLPGELKIAPSDNSGK